MECIIGINCFQKLKLQLQLQNIWIYFAKVESDIVLISAQIELIGFGLNSEKLEQIKEILLKKKKEIEDKINNSIGKKINLNSFEDVSYLLYNVLKLKPVNDEKIKARQNNEKLQYHSTCKDVLQQMVTQHEFPRLIILWRKIQHSLANSIFPIEKVQALIECLYF